jgi:hypothetical protein
MPDVPRPSTDRKPLVTQVQPRHRPERPPASPCCRAPGWWNGWRRVFPVMVRALGGVVERCEGWVAIAKCSACRHGFTCYPPGYYPRRQFQLDVVAEVVAQASLGGGALRAAAAPVGTSRTSAWRWAHWVAALAAPAELYAVATRLDPDAPVGVVPQAVVMAPVRAAAAQVLAALEQVGLALRRVGRGLEAATGLGRVLGWQYREHALVVGLGDRLGDLSSGM